ncbi:MAG: hypothetical protein LBN31_04085 [Hungatella sp.]|jgi:hypothetical protein|nr:hypothetical protein [Hungatella sp.]
MKKTGYLILTLAEILLLAGTYIIHYFTRKKMGMARYVIYKNQSWERTFPMETLKYTAVAVLTALTLLLLAALGIKRRRQGKLVAAMHFVMIILTTLYAAFTCISSTEIMRAYYFISLMLGTAALFQIIKAGAALMMCGKKKDE